MKRNLIFAMLILLALGCKNTAKKDNQGREPVSVKTHSIEKTETAADSIPVIPIHHASFVIKLNNHTIYVDPTGNPSAYAKLPKPDFVLITHGHPDHYSSKTLEALVSVATPIIAPKAVKEKMPKNLKAQTQTMGNGDHKTLMGIGIAAIPAYNLLPDALKFHPKGVGNGYVLSYGGKRVYISGDTGDIPALRQLKNIDLAFVCMNLPYTMTVDQAVDAVLAFKPKKVHPYHYRGAEGFSDIHKFKTEVEAQDPSIAVELLDWYPDQPE